MHEAAFYFAGFERVKEEKLMANEHVTMETKRKYRDVIEYLPENLRNGYTMYTTKPDSELAAQFERFVTDPYVAPLMAESLAGTTHSATCTLIPVSYCWLPVSYCWLSLSY